MEPFLQDLRYAFRAFLRAPAFTALVILILAIGIGANTAIFSAVNTLLLRPLPFKEPEQLMKVSLTSPATGSEPSSDDRIWSYPKFTVFRDAQTVFTEVALYTDFQFTLRGGGETERTKGELASARYLSTLGVEPVLGRNFLPEEDRLSDGSRVVLLSDELWKRRFNANPAVLGDVLSIDGQPYTIVGVLPAGFRGLSGQSDLWVPIVSHPDAGVDEAWNHSYTLIARRKPGVSAEQATAVTKQLGARVDDAYAHPEVHDEHWGATARPLDAMRVDPIIRRSLLVLLGAVGLVLLITCANVANLLLVRANGRRREIAVRMALGAGRARLVRQLLTEGLLLSFCGGVASLFVASWGVSLLTRLNPGSALGVQRLAGIGAVNFTSIHLDLTAFAFTAALALTTGLLFGLIPALQATRPSLTAELKEGSTRIGRPGAMRGLTSRNALVVAEIALALVLLAGSGLMLRSLEKLLGVRPGFEAEHVLTMRLTAAEGLGRDSLPGFYDQMLERLAALPGVTSVALGDCPPLNGGCNGTIIARRDQSDAAPGSEPLVGVHWVTPSWTSALQVPLQRGRFLTEADRLGAQKVVVINETAARTFWPGEDPIGRPVSVGQGGFWEDTAYVVGVVGDVRFGTLDSQVTPDVYLSYYQSPRGRMMLFVRTSGDPLAIAAAARRTLREMAPDIPVYDIRTLESRVSDSMSYARFSTLLLTLFGALALALATLGTYGVISFSVAQRTRELGIRSALGATPGNIVRLVTMHGIGLVAIGGALGLAVALGATRILRSMLYDVAPSDPATYAVIAVVLALAVFLASYPPARRAARVNPMVALRAE